MKKAVLSLSGGMDSTCLLVNLLASGYEAKCYSFDYGQRHSVELERVAKNIAYLQSKGHPVSWRMIDIKTVFDESSSSLLPQSGNNIPEGHYEDASMKSTVVENRNGIFSAIVYGKALAWANESQEDVVICLGIHSGDHSIYPDCRPESREAFAKAFSISNWGSERVDYYTPYLEGNKTSILQDMQVNCEKEGVDLNILLQNTNTCYNPDAEGKSCGKCGSCQERLEAFTEIGIKDPVQYK